MLPNGSVSKPHSNYLGCRLPCDACSIPRSFHSISHPRAKTSAIMAGVEDAQHHAFLAVAARTTLFFLALFTGLCIVLMGRTLFQSLDDAYFFPKDPALPPDYIPEAYPAVVQFIPVVFAAMVMWIIVVQLNHQDPHPKTAARLEMLKGLSATAAWLWLLLDIINFVPRHDPYWKYRERKIVFRATSIIILFIFFYPLMFWRAILARQAKQKAGVVEQRATRDESTPLLQHQ
ncbi:hypothetical protein KVR01_011805 [Diaporthe batatas]|uniref:uncharacterized protein n=1 Tax=Diaporthe batatas TaxID=748121 RepID=UPI001D04733B|nr:uncharacterized protein KVR01_011805 [Diaporthe batatas]KAG8158683.1 hypothetical protein KVR01_011805 [Diaporthe batatas]